MDQKKEKKKYQDFKLTQDQISDFKEGFSLFDKDSSGYIRTQDLGLLIRSLNQNPTQQEVNEYINEVDPDETGFIDFPEFISLMARKWKDVDGEEVLMDAFQAFDKEKNGMCSTQELQVVLKQLGEKLTEEETNQLIQLADPNNQKSFRYEDFIRVLTTHYIN